MRITGTDRGPGLATSMPDQGRQQTAVKIDFTARKDCLAWKNRNQIVYVVCQSMELALRTQCPTGGELRCTASRLTQDPTCLGQHGRMVAQPQGHPHDPDWLRKYGLPATTRMTFECVNNQKRMSARFKSEPTPPS